MLQTTVNKTIIICVTCCESIKVGTTIEMWNMKSRDFRRLDEMEQKAKDQNYQIICPNRNA